MTVPDQVWLESFRPGPDGGSYRFEQPIGEVVAQTPQEVKSALQQVESAVRDGTHAVALIPYEAAPAFDTALDVGSEAGALPVAWFGLFGERHEIVAGGAGPVPGVYALQPWQPRLDASAHAAAVDTIRDYIGAGDAYQVNFTFPMEAAFTGDPTGLYRAMCRAQGSAAFCAYLDLGDSVVLSASPELFFALDGVGRIRTRPMKGTRRRGRWSAEDQALRESLSSSAKDRAENLMIVDLLRNDLGRVAAAGSVEVSSLWEVEAYDSVWQMTSTILGQVRKEVGLYELFAALFPCGSVTGAPKVRATQIIKELEVGRRGAYTGTIGFLSPTGVQDERRLSGIEAVFNVAIRTVTVNHEAGLATAGVGGGIIWDSEPALEYAECLDKTRFLRSPGPASGRADKPADFQLFETLLFEPETGYYLLDRHLRRLLDSADFFGFTVDEAALRRQLEHIVTRRTHVQRIRLSLARDGVLSTDIVDYHTGPLTLTAVVATDTVDTEDVFLYHKTTNRDTYTDALATARCVGADEVILHNAHGELTECSIGNLVVERGGRRITPPVESGLLAGTFRAELLDTGKLEVGVLTADDLYGAAAVYRINSVRRWVRLDVCRREDELQLSSKERVPCTG